MTIAEIKDVLDQLAEAGTLFLTLSGGEIFMRRDFFEILEYARRLLFNVRLKTNGVMIRQPEAERLLRLGVEQIQISVYSHRAEVHDAITKLPGSLRRTINAIQFLKSQGLNIILANVLMTANRHDHAGVRALARELGVTYSLDPTITPKIDGDRSILNLRVSGSELNQLFHEDDLVGDAEQYCAPPPPPGEDEMQALPCHAGHTTIYISPYGDVFPCVQFPLPSGNVRRQKFIDIWQNSTALKEVRSIRVKDLPVCSTCSHAGTCSRCPGLAYMEGNMRWPSTTDCEKSYQRTGIPSANMLRMGRTDSSGAFVQIQPLAILN